MTLIECGTHALIDAVFDGVANASEIALAPRLIPSLRPGMLLLADRNFPGYELWGQARSSGADLLWRAKSSHHLVPTQNLPDGSYLSLMPAARNATGWPTAAGPAATTHPARGIRSGSSSSPSPAPHRADHEPRSTDSSPPCSTPRSTPRSPPPPNLPPSTDNAGKPKRPTTTSNHASSAAASPCAPAPSKASTRSSTPSSPSTRYSPPCALTQPPRPASTPTGSRSSHTPPQPQPTPTRRHHRNHQRPAWPPSAPHQPSTTHPTLRQLRLQAPRRAPTMPARHPQNRHPAA